MAAIDRAQIAREIYGGYESGNRAVVEQHLSRDFRFYSPADVGIDLSAYWTRCWPNADLIAAFELRRMIEHGDELVVTYEATRTDGTRFRNTEILTFDGDRVAVAEVYFGWDLG